MCLEMPARAQTVLLTTYVDVYFSGHLWHMVVAGYVTPVAQSIVDMYMQTTPWDITYTCNTIYIYVVYLLSEY